MKLRTLRSKLSKAQTLRLAVLINGELPPYLYSPLLRENENGKITKEALAGFLEAARYFEKRGAAGVTIRPIEIRLSGPDTLRVLDRLIAKLGPEYDIQASSLGGNPSEERTGSSDGPPQGSDPSPQGDGHATGGKGSSKGQASPTSAPSKRGAGEPSSGVAAPPDGGEAAASDNSPRDGESAARDAEGADRPEKDDEGSPAGEAASTAGAPEQSDETGGVGSESAQTAQAGSSGSGPSGNAPSQTERKEHGGVCDDAAEAELLRRSARTAAKEVVRALRRLFRKLDVGLGEEPSLRLSVPKLVREIVSRSVRLARIKRTELERPLGLVLADVSGSCSAAATGTVAAALALTEEDRDLLVVRHSNGYVESVHGRPAKEILRKKKGEIKDLLGFEDLSLRGIVAFGDWDAAWAYERLCAKAPFVWLDSYAAKHGVKPASSNLREGYRSWTAFPVAHYQGVNSAETAAIALRNAEALMR
jgi:hypothetical protein